MNKRYIPLLIALLFLGMITGNAFGQDRAGQTGKGQKNESPRRERQQKASMVTVESIIKDPDGKPLQNVLVSGKEGAIEVMTDANGHFSITVPEQTTLLFEAEGYETKVLSLTETVPATVSLVKAAFLMEDKNMVNIAFGKVRKKELIGAVSTVDPKEMKKNDNTESFYDALTGNVPGLLGSNNLRGVGTALIVVDGVPRDPSRLNLSEIEQISVLKDGNAAMLWGSKAQNGVILVTTKRGEAFKHKVDVSVERGFSTPVALPHYLGTADYYRLNNEALVNDGQPVKYADSTIAHYADGRSPYRYPSVDYYSSQFLKSFKPTERALAEMSGGNDVTQYYGNVGWTRSGTLYSAGQGQFMSSNRFNMRANVNFKVNDYIKATVDAVVIFDQQKNPNGANGNLWGNAATLHPDYYSPLLPIALVQKTPALAAQLLTARKLMNNAYILGGTGTYKANPYGNLFLAGDSTAKQQQATVSQSLEVDLRNITKGLKFKTFMSFDIYNTYSVQTLSTYAIYNPTWKKYGTRDSISALTMTGTDATSGVQSIPTTSNSSFTTPYFERRIGANAMLDYDRTFKDVHHVTATLLAYWDKFRINNVTIDEKEAHVGLRATYDYKQKYLVDFTSVYTNGFHLPPGHMGGYSPSVALGWNLSEEDFLKDSKCVDFLKLRASASIQDIDPTANLGQEYRPYAESFQNGSFFNYNDGNPPRQTRTVTLMRSANPNLTFEKMKSLNAGIEGYFFNRFLYLDANVFTQRWEDQVIRATALLPAWVGNNNPFVNYNTTGYSGGELGMRLMKSFGKFSVNLGTNFLYATSKVIKRNELNGFAYQNRVGKSADAIFGLKAIGLFQSATDISDSPAQKFSPAKPGDIKYADINNDGKIDSNDAIEIGNSQAKFSYGLNMVLRYGGLSLMATGDGRLNYEYMESGSYFIEDGNAKYSTEILNRWTPATALTATYPRMSSGTNTNNNQASTYWLQNGNYFRLNRLQLTLNIPKKLIQNWATKEISLYVRGSNLNMWTAKQYQRQLVIGGEPNYRSFALGVNILF
jgi:TonB-linked SusC/RagA family outer membrane protein